jgi:predicted secreted hydrolase
MKPTLATALMLLLIPVPAANAGDWAPVTPAGRQWSFPADHRSHPEYKTEWWYLTGQLEAADDPGRRFGYQFTFFRVGLLPEMPSLDSLWAAGSLIMGHASITDAANGKHWFSEVLWRDSPLFGGFGADPGAGIASCIGPAGTSTRWSLTMEGDGFRIRMEDRRQEMALDLLVTAEKPMVFQGPGGVSRKGKEPGAASYYYSFTRMATAGAIGTSGGSLEVSGTSWMDREFFSSELTGGQTGWDWFSIQLADGRELMLYQLRNSGGTPAFGRGTMVPVNGEPVYLDMERDWELQVTGSWTSPETGISYPSGWELEVAAPGDPGKLRLRITPLVPHQENVSRRSGLAYWEGAVIVRPAGAATGAPPIGRGYVEMTGYGMDNRPPV